MNEILYEAAFRNKLRGPFSAKRPSNRCRPISITTVERWIARPADSRNPEMLRLQRPAISRREQSNFARA